MSSIKIAEVLAHKYTKNSFGRIDLEDARSAALFGLIKAAQNFEPERGLAFQTYAWKKIESALMDLRRSEMRTRGWRRGQNGKPRQRYSQRVEWPMGEDGPIELIDDRVPDPDDAVEHEQLLRLVLSHVTRPVDRAIVELLLEGKTHLEIAAHFDVSESLINQYYHRLIRQLRQKLGAHHG